jgi:hypothetical protein
VCGIRASESTIIGLIIPESATGIVGEGRDICRFQGVTALALTTLWKPWVFAINLRSNAIFFSQAVTLRSLADLAMQRQR